MTMGWARTSPVIDRGPVCECDDPRCFEPLGLSWKSFGLLTKRRTALVVKQHVSKLADCEAGRPRIVADKGAFVVVRYA
jgi:hypothetical protein